MAICRYCKLDMSSPTTTTCVANVAVEYPDGIKHPTSTYHFSEADGRCHDCNIVHGGKHHPGCDVELCPRCDGQLISCGCLDKGDE